MRAQLLVAHAAGVRQRRQRRRTVKVRHSLTVRPGTKPSLPYVVDTLTRLPSADTLTLRMHCGMSMVRELEPATTTAFITYDVL